MKRFLSVFLILVLMTGILSACAEEPAETTVLPEVGDVIEGFEVLEIRDFPLVGAKVVLFEHQKTGAGLTYIANEDTNRVFDLVFLTRPTDETGLPHIFEHATLSGSEKWPSKSLWFNVAYQTYTTYINAMTMNVLTTFPVASLSEAQLLKLADYYTDSCLHPMVLEDESIFREEAWRYRMASTEDDLTIEGTVYSEMLGALDLNRQAGFNAYQAAFPGSVVGMNQGGNPDHIPEMTWESLKNYHSLYYHPSNCMAYLYGQFDDYAAFLKLLDTAFAPYEKEDFHFVDSGYVPLEESVEVNVGFPTDEGSDPSNQSMIYYYLVCPGLSDDAEEEMILNTLTDLLNSSASPMMTRLDQALPSGSFGSYIETAAPDDAIVIYATNVNPEDAALFRETVQAGLEDISENGFSQDLVDGVMASVKLSTMLVTEDSDVGVNLLTNIAYSFAADGNPFSYMDYVDALSEMDDWNQQGRYQAAVKKWLIDNSTTALVTTYPEPGQKEVKAAELAQQLAQVKAAMTEEEIQAVIESSNAVPEEEDTSAMVASLQAVTVASLPEEVRTYDIYDDNAGDDGVRRIDAVAGVEGVGDVILLLDAKGLPQEAIHYFHLYTSLLGELNTASHTKEELDVLKNRYLYSPEIRLSIMPMETGDYQPWLRVSWYALDEDLAAGYDLMAELLYDTQFDDVEKLTDEIVAAKAATRFTINNYAYSVALYRSMVSNPLLQYYSYYNYVEYYEFLDQLEAQMAEDPTAVVEALKTVQDSFRNRTGAVAAFAGNEESIAINRPLADAFMAKLESRPLEHVDYQLPCASAREALIVDSSVQYNALTANYPDLDMDGFDASMDAIFALVKDVYLYPLLRDQYGVYSVFASASQDDGIYLLSYRDPNIVETYDVYDSLADLMEAQEVDQATLDGYIISSYSAYAQSTGELSGAVNAIFNVLEGKSQDYVLTYMRQLKAVTPESVKASAEMFRRLSEKGVRYTAGSAAAIYANDSLYDVILNPFNAQDTSSIVLTDAAEGSEYYDAVRFVLENGLMSPLTEDTFGVTENATNGDLLAAIYVVAGGPSNAPEQARDWLAEYGLVSATMDLQEDLNESLLCNLINGVFGQQILDTDTPDLTVPRCDLADLLKMLLDQ